MTHGVEIPLRGDVPPSLCPSPADLGMETAWETLDHCSRWQSHRRKGRPPGAGRPEPLWALQLGAGKPAGLGEARPVWVTVAAPEPHFGYRGGKTVTTCVLLICMFEVFYKERCWPRSSEGQQTPPRDRARQDSIRGPLSIGDKTGRLPGKTG